jgi:nitroreductase
MKRKVAVFYRILIIFIVTLLTGTCVSAQMKSTAVPVSNSKPAMKESTGDQSDFWNVIYNRRSVRKFKADAIPEADIRKIIDAARMSPTSGNQQPWKFLVIRDKKLILQMMEACIKESLTRYDANPNANETRDQFKDRISRTLASGYFSAPVFIVVLTDNNSTYPDYNHWDGPLAAGYLMLAARALGYGTVFITDAIPENVTKEVLQIPDTYTRVCITPLGIPVEWPATPPKKDLKDMIFFDKL